MKGGRFLVVFVTCPTKRSANRIAAAVIRQRLAACVNIVPGIASWFWWQGKTTRARELLLIIKTTARSFERLRQAVVKLHPYDVPEVIAMPLSRGHGPYLRWLTESVAPSE